MDNRRKSGEMGGENERIGGDIADMLQEDGVECVESKDRAEGAI